MSAKTIAVQVAIGVAVVLLAQWLGPKLGIRA